LANLSEKSKLTHPQSRWCVPKMNMCTIHVTSPTASASFVRCSISVSWSGSSSKNSSIMLFLCHVKLKELSSLLIVLLGYIKLNGRSASWKGGDGHYP
jgi:hypothetical protein